MVRDTWRSVLWREVCEAVEAEVETDRWHEWRMAYLLRVSLPFAVDEWPDEWPSVKGQT